MCEDVFIVYQLLPAKWQVTFLACLLPSLACFTIHSHITIWWSNGMSETMMRIGRCSNGWSINPGWNTTGTYHCHVSSSLLAILSGCTHHPRFACADLPSDKPSINKDNAAMSAIITTTLYPSEVQRFPMFYETDTKIQRNTNLELYWSQTQTLKLRWNHI